MKILECKNLTKEYLSGEGVVKAIDDITLSFEQGEFVAITGPSAAANQRFFTISVHLKIRQAVRLSITAKALKTITITSFRFSEEDASASSFSHIT